MPPAASYEDVRAAYSFIESELQSHRVGSAILLRYNMVVHAVDALGDYLNTLVENGHLPVDMDWIRDNYDIFNESHEDNDCIARFTWSDSADADHAVGAVVLIHRDSASDVEWDLMLPNVSEWPHKITSRQQLADILRSLRIEDLSSRPRSQSQPLPPAVDTSIKLSERLCSLCQINPAVCTSSHPGYPGKTEIETRYHCNACCNHGISYSGNFCSPILIPTP